MESLQAGFRALSTGFVLPVMVPDIDGLDTPFCMFACFSGCPMKMKGEGVLTLGAVSFGPILSSVSASRSRSCSTARRGMNLDDLMLRSVPMFSMAGMFWTRSHQDGTHIFVNLALIVAFSLSSISFNGEMSSFLRTFEAKTLYNTHELQSPAVLVAADGSELLNSTNPW